MSSSTTAGGRRATTRAAARSGPWYRNIDWSNSFWGVLVLGPLVLTVSSPAPPATKAVAVVGLVGFVVVYAWAVSTLIAWFEPPDGGTGPRDRLRMVGIRLAVMAVPAALSLPVMGRWYVFFLPYFCAVVLYAAPLRTGLGISSLLCLGGVAGAVASQDPGYISGALGCCASTVFILVARIGDEFSLRRDTAQRELAAAQQREEIGRDVHDILGHSLTVLTLKAEVAQRMVRRDPAATEAELAEIVVLSRAALADVRATVTRLRIPELAGQIEASRTAFSAAGIEAVFAGRDEDVPLAQREILAWALLEATTNVVRHARARRVDVELAPGRLRVADDGVGLGGAPDGNGLTGLRERVKAAGGTLVVTASAAGDTARRPGTVLEVTL